MGLNKKSVDDINVKGQKVLVRCDFNVPLKEGKITDKGSRSNFMLFLQLRNLLLTAERLSFALHLANRRESRNLELFLLLL